MESSALFLIIDDEPDLLEAMARILHRNGHRVVTASTGAEGIRLAVEQQPDIAVVDVMLPDMNGLEVCKQIQAGRQSGKTDTILISGSRITAEDQVDGFNVGVCEYLTRPLDNKEFLARVSARLKAKQTRDSLQLDRNKARKTSAHEKSQRMYLEKELQTIFSYAPICLFLTDGEARLTRANPALAKIFGGDVQSRIGAPCGIAFDCVHNADHISGCGYGASCASCGLRNAITDTFTTGTSHIQVESSLNCRQQDRIIERIVRFSTSLVMLAQDKRVFVCMEDITEQEKSIKALQKSEELFRRTFDQSPIGAAMVGLDYRFLKVNQELCRITGYTADELVNLRFPEITCAEDLDYNLKQSEFLVQGLIDQYEMDKRYIRKDGQQIWVQLSARLIRDNQGKPLYFLPMMVEIDTRKRLGEEKEIQLELFRMINENSDLKTLVEGILTFFKSWSGADALALRLQQGNDFLYDKTVGFAKDCMSREKSPKSLQHKDREASMGRDRISLEGVYGLVINGLYDTSWPFFTAGGSFFTNSTSLLVSPSDILQMPATIRKYCSEAGYESVLIVPLRVGENILGLIQLNQNEKNCFSSEFISLVERLASHISAAVVLRLAEEKLKAKQAELEEMNAALKVLIRNREEDLLEHDRGVLTNIRQLILPCIDRLKLGSLDIQQKSQLIILESNLNTISSPFAKKLSSAHSALTPSLIQVADMIRKGFSNKEIAPLLGVSVKTVETYRKRIRERLQLKNSKINLRAHLLNMP